MRRFDGKAGFGLGMVGAALLVGMCFQAAAVTTTRLVPAQPSQVAPQQVSVLVFFDFKPASQALFRHLNAWAALADRHLVLDREPLVDADAAPLARAFVVARTLGVTAAVLPALFRLAAARPAARQTGGTPSALESAIADIFNAIGINDIEFEAAWNSPATTAGMVRARAMAERFEVKAAPRLVVNGAWLLAAQSADGPAQLVSALEQRIAMLVTRTAAE